MRCFLPSLLTGTLALTLVACDATSPSAPDLGPGAFEAVVASPDSEVTLGGVASASLSAEDAAFDGTFGSYVVAETDDGTSYTFSSIELRADSGEEILLGTVAPGDGLASGAYGIETSRNLDAPFDFVVLYDADGASGRGGSAAARANAGAVEIDVDGDRVSGTFDLTFEDGLSVSGSFNAAPADA
ncbi:MAG: hypothetical protein AAF845_13195 [Bacteroidota bacterium]